jgi:hypothetical protein
MHQSTPDPHMRRRTNRAVAPRSMPREPRRTNHAVALECMRSTPSEARRENRQWSTPTSLLTCCTDVRPLRLMGLEPGGSLASSGKRRHGSCSAARMHARATARFARRDEQRSGSCGTFRMHACKSHQRPGSRGAISSGAVGAARFAAPTARHGWRGVIRMHARAACTPPSAPCPNPHLPLSARCLMRAHTAPYSWWSIPSTSYFSFAAQTCMGTSRSQRKPCTQHQRMVVASACL